MEDKAQNIFNLYKENNLLEKVPENKHCQFAIIFDTKNEFILRGQRYFCRLDSFQLDPDISKWTRRGGSPSWCWLCPLYRTGFSPANFRVKSIENVQNLLIPEQMNIYETLEQIDDRQPWLQIHQRTTLHFNYEDWTFLSSERCSDWVWLCGRWHGGLGCYGDKSLLWQVSVWPLLACEQGMRPSQGRQTWPWVLSKNWESKSMKFFVFSVNISLFSEGYLAL